MNEWLWPVSGAGAAKPGDPPGYDYIFKFVIVGAASTGKTCFLDVLGRHHFHREHRTSELSFKIFTRRCHGKTIKVMLWEKPASFQGWGEFNSVYRGAMGIFAFYDTSDRQSLIEGARAFIGEVVRHVREGVPIVLVGTKSDLGLMTLTREEITSFCQELGVRHHLVVSNSTGQNVELAFKVLTELVLQEKIREEAEQAVAVAVPKRSKDCSVM